MRHRFPILIAVLAAVISAAATAVVSLAQDDGVSASPPSAGGPSRVSALNRPQLTSDKLPAGILEKFGSANAEGPQVDPASARRIAHLGDADIYVAEGPASVCAIRSSAAGWAGGCAGKDLVSGGSPQVSFSTVESDDGNDYRVWGVAPAGVRNVAVTFANGRTVDGSLVNGAFDITTDDPGAAFVWTDSNGLQHSEPVVLPPAHPDAK